MKKELKIKVQCVGCGATKEVCEEQTEQPMCDLDFMPMIAVEITL